MNSDQNETEDKQFYIIVGIFLIICGIAAILFLPEVNFRRWLGITGCLLLGLSLCVAGSPDPNEKKDKF